MPRPREVRAVEQIVRCRQWVDGLSTISRLRRRLRLTNTGTLTHLSTGEKNQGYISKQLSAQLDEKFM